MKFQLNLYIRELKAHKKGLFFWSMGMVFMILTGMSKYQGYKAAGDSVNDMLAGLPEGLLAVFGGGEVDFTQAIWFYSILFLYLLIMGAIHAAMLGAEIIVKEERDKTYEFLYVNPLSRARAITAKLFAGLTNIFILNLVTLIASIIIVEAFNDGDIIFNKILLLMVGLFFVQTIFLSIGMAVAAVIKKSKLASPVATTFLLVTFFLAMFIKIKGSVDYLKYFTPFYYFDGETIINDNALDPVFIFISCSVIVFMLTTTYLFYEKRDLNT